MCAPAPPAPLSGLGAAPWLGELASARAPPDDASPLSTHAGKVLRVADQLPADRDVLVHCKSGVRSAAACHALAAHGLSRLYNLDGGILGWARQVDPTMPTY